MAAHCCDILYRTVKRNDLKTWGLKNLLIWQALKCIHHPHMTKMSPAHPPTTLHTTWIIYIFLKTDNLPQWVDVWICNLYRNTEMHYDSHTGHSSAQRRLYCLLPGLNDVRGIFTDYMTWSFLWSVSLNLSGKLKGMWLLQCSKGWTNPGLGHNILETPKLKIRLW